MRKAISRIALVLVIILAAPAFGQSPGNSEIKGRVVGITDGDTLTLLTPDNRQIKVRLADIDAPEHNQPYGEKAKQALSTLAFGQEARIVDKGLDKYGRTIGRVYVGSTDVNAALVSQGVAWVYRKYNADPKLLDLETFAKNTKQGLWVLPESQRIPPWEWRHPAAAPALPTPAPAAPIAQPAPIKPEPIRPAAAPTSSDGCPADKPHHVSGYTRKDGTIVKDYCRR